MQIFLDSANQKEIKKWLHQGVIDRTYMMETMKRMAKVVDQLRKLE